MKKEFKQMWVCLSCGSIHLQQLNAVVNLNENTIDWDRSMDLAEYECLDSGHRTKPVLKTIKTVNGSVRVQGYQVEDVAQNPHPAMEASFCLYSLEQAKAMLLDDSVPGNWYLKAYYKGDVEKPTLMFEGKDPRKTS